jgi:hypothetical protein
LISIRNLVSYDFAICIIIESAFQLPLAHWHDYLGQATLADAILDRLVHNAYKLELKGESMRKKKNPLTANPTQG